ncbi:MAG: TSUP family transporter [Lachnospiraceae bacterium]|nr:TSUP family transporter [Lachnospiraceae bacterium]
MELTANTFFIVLPLVFCAGFIDSIAGGGGLISLPAYMLAGVPIHRTIATNKLSSGMGTAVSFFHFLKKGYMQRLICIPAVTAAVLGSFTGAKLSLITEERVLQALLLLVLPVAAFYVLKNKSLGHAEGALASHDRRQILLCAAVAFVVGVYDGLYGPGTGTFLMLLLTGLCKLSLNEAAGTAKAINLTTNLTSLTVFLVNGQVLFPLGLAAGICNMLGNYAGSHCFSSRGEKIAKPFLLIVLALLFLKMIWELF